MRVLDRSSPESAYPLVPIHHAALSAHPDIGQPEHVGQPASPSEAVSSDNDKKHHRPSTNTGLVSAAAQP
jgi:hypothetical protein